MSLKEQVQQDMKAAMKAQNKLELSVIRMVWSALRKTEIDSGGDVDDAGVVGIVQKEIKSIDEKIGFLEQGNRAEDIEEENKKKAVLQRYLPKQLSEDELRDIVQKTKSEVGASGPRDMGKMMGKLVPQLKGQCDGKLLSSLVKEALSE